MGDIRYLSQNTSAKVVVCSVRLFRVLIIWGRCIVVLGKPFEQVTREDVERIVSTLMKQGLVPSTMATYKSVLKSFLCFVLAPEQFPNIRTTPKLLMYRKPTVSGVLDLRAEQYYSGTFREVVVCPRREHEE
jgi:hypothetical protein